jgi:hypothetical protein
MAEDVPQGHLPIFASEALLQQAIAGLLARLPEVTNVQILQGTQEFGKDIVFYVRGGFGERMLCACVVKNHKITGEVDSSKGARTVLLQAQQAFDTAHFDGAGSEERVQRVYVVTPSPLLPATIASIRGRLSERSGQVVFIGGSELFDLLRKYWPNFVSEEYSALQKHLASLSGSVHADDPVRNVANLYNLGDIEKSPETVYVGQNFYRDILHFNKSSVASAFVPSDRDFSTLWKRSRVDQALHQLESLKRHLLTAAEWGYVKHGSLKRSLFPSFDTFGKMLEDSFGESLRRAYAPMRSSVPNVGRDAKVILHNARSLSENSEQLRSKIDEWLRPFYARLKEASAALKANAEALSRLADPSYRVASTLLDFYQVVPAFFSRRDEVTRVDFPKELIDVVPASVLITGAAGFGKTSFCKWHALADAERYRTGCADTLAVLPVYTPLHKLVGSELASFDDLLSSQIGASALLAGTDEDFRGKRVRIYLDGLDEVADQSQRRRIVSIAEEAVKNGRVSQVVMTTRDYIYGPWLTWLLRFGLKGFDKEQTVQLVDKWLGTATSENSRFWREIAGSESLSALMRTPLLATLIVLVFRQTGRLPENEARLYDIFTDLLSEGWNLAKRILKLSKYGSQVKTGVLRRLAVKVHESRQRQFQLDDLVTAAERCVHLDEGAIQELVQEILHDGLVAQSPKSCEFCHLSFQEYLTAKHYAGDPTQRGVKRALKAYLAGDDWWYQVLRFYIGLSGSPEEIDRWLALQEDRVTPLYEDVDPHERSRELAAILNEIYPQFKGFA